MAPKLQNPLKENIKKGATTNTQVAWLVTTFVLCLVCGPLFVVFFKRIMQLGRHSVQTQNFSQIPQSLIHSQIPSQRAAPPAGTGRRPESEQLSTRRSSRCRRYQRPHSNLPILPAPSAHADAQPPDPPQPEESEGTSTPPIPSHTPPSTDLTRCRRTRRLR